MTLPMGMVTLTPDRIIITVITTEMIIIAAGGDLPVLWVLRFFPFPGRSAEVLRPSKGQHDSDQ